MNAVLVAAENVPPTPAVFGVLDDDVLVIRVPILVHLVKVDRPHIIPRFFCMITRPWVHVVEVWFRETVLSPPGIGCTNTWLAL